MTKACPICNFETKIWEESNDSNVCRVDCHDCGKYMIDKECAQDFRRQYLSFDVSTIGGKQLYDHNIKVIRSYVKRHHRDVLNHSILNSLHNLYAPRK